MKRAQRPAVRHPSAQAQGVFGASLCFSSFLWDWRFDWRSLLSGIPIALLRGVTTFSSPGKWDALPGPSPPATDSVRPTDLDTGPSAWAPPVYPYILAGVFKLFGVYSETSAWVILAFNSIFGALTCVPLYFIAHEMYGAGVARASAWTWVLFPYAIYWPVRVVWETSLSTFLLTLALLLTLRMAQREPGNWSWIGFGALWGLIMLINTALVSVLPVMLLWLWYHSRHTRPRKTLAGAAWCALAIVVVISPWLIRNYATFGEFVFIRDNLALEMHMANNGRSNGLWTRSEHPGNDPEAMREFQKMGELPFMKAKQREVRQFIRQHPGEFLAFTLERAVYYWAGTPQISIVGKYDFIVLRHTLFLLTSALAFAGLWLTLQKRIKGGVLLGCVLFFYSLPYYVVNPFPRYKHPIEPVMIMLIVYLLMEAQKVQLHWRPLNKRT